MSAPAAARYYVQHSSLIFSLCHVQAPFLRLKCNLEGTVASCCGQILIVARRRKKPCIYAIDRSGRRTFSAALFSPQTVRVYVHTYAYVRSSHLTQRIIGRDPRRPRLAGLPPLFFFFLLSSFSLLASDTKGNSRSGQRAGYRCGAEKRPGWRLHPRVG